MGFWEWFTLITGSIGMVAFLMATQPFTQAIWGRPKIFIDFGTNNMKDCDYFQCNIWNTPITKGILNFIRVRRDDAKDVIAFFSIEEKGSNRVIFQTPTAVKIKTQSEQLVERASLPSSLFPISFAIIAVPKNSDKVLILHDSMDDINRQLLHQGVYTVKVKVNIEGREYKKQHDLTVQNIYPFACWK
jgi:hypothetical protein